MAVKDYIDTNDFTKEELLDMIELAQSMKAMIKEGALPADPQEPDARHDLSSRCPPAPASPETGMTDLGGHAQFFLRAPSSPAATRSGGHRPRHGLLVDILILA